MLHVGITRFCFNCFFTPNKAKTYLVVFISQRIPTRPLPCCQRLNFHYGIRSDEVDILDENEINTTAEILLEDPVGDQEVRDLLFLVAD